MQFVNKRDHSVTDATPQNRRRTKSLDHGAATVSEGHAEPEPPIGWKGCAKTTGSISPKLV